MWCRRLCWGPSREDAAAYSSISRDAEPAGLILGGEAADLARLHSAPPSLVSSTAPWVRKVVFGSMRFPAPPEALELQAQLKPLGIMLKIVDIEAGGNITKEVFAWIERADFFLVFGTAHYGEDTGNPASSYREAVYAEGLRKQIILLRMIPWTDQFAHLQARVMFGMNSLTLTWLPGTPIPEDLVPSLARAILGDTAPAKPNFPVGPTHERDALVVHLPTQEQEHAAPQPNLGAVLSPVCASSIVPMAERKYDFFINHAQTSGQDQCGKLALLLKGRGLSVWYDMEADDLTEQGMELGVANSRNVLIFLSKGLMGRPYCQKEQRWAIRYGCKFVGVMETDDRHGKTDFAIEKAAAPADLRQLLDEIEFQPYQRREYLVEAMLDEIVRRGNCQARSDATQASSNSTLVAASSADMIAHQESVHTLFALQSPPMVVGQASAHVRTHGLLEEIEARLERKQAELVSGNQYPICLVDAASSGCDVETRLQQGLVHCLVWCANGDGWEARHETHPITTLERIVQTVETLGVLWPEASPPQLAVIVMPSAAKRAAKKLHRAGVSVVLWLTADMMCSYCSEIFCGIIQPAVKMLDDNRTLEIVSKFVFAELSSLREREPQLPVPSFDNCGCLSDTSVKQWSPGPLSKTRPWLSKHCPEMLPHNIIYSCKRLKDLELCACDLGRLSDVRTLLWQSSRVMVVLEDAADSAGRCRAVALSVCTSALCEQGRERVLRISKAAELEAAIDSSGGVVGRWLLWIDVLGMTTTVDDINAMLHLLIDEGAAQVILTCDDDWNLQTDRLEVIEDFADRLAFKDVDIGRSEGSTDVRTDECHDEIKLFVSSMDSANSGQLSLLNIFKPTHLSTVLAKLLQERPVAGIYLADESNAVRVRLCISDVGFLHALRDKLLNGNFGAELDSALNDPQMSRMVDYAELGAIKTSVDRTHFAEVFDNKILSLTVLTAHQRKALAECVESTADVHVKAAAGTGKTFVAMHFMLEELTKIRREKDKRILYVARNRPLVLHVAHWLAKRGEEKSSKEMKRLLGHLHVASEPFKSILAVTMTRGCLQFAETSAMVPYSLVVIDEAHHIFRDEELRSSVAKLKTERTILLSDVAQGLYPGLEYPKCNEVILSQVVRSSRRIVEGAAQFQLMEERASRDCLHAHSGPPLCSFLFDLDHSTADFYECYAHETLRALQEIESNFPGLNLDGRLAVIVPHKSFCSGLQPSLQRMIDEDPAGSFTTRCLTLVDAEAACDARLSTSAVGTEERIILDEISALDGLERLIVVCVGLDRSIDDAGSETIASRSMLYRAMTRAHMAVYVVNEYLPDGWFKQLINVEFTEDQHNLAALEDIETADQVVARQCENESQADAELAKLKSNLRPVHVEKERAVLKKQVIEALVRGSSVEDAVKSTQIEWAVRDAVVAAATAEGISDPDVLSLLRKVATPKLKILEVAAKKSPEVQTEVADATLSAVKFVESAVELAVDEWKQSREALSAAVIAEQDISQLLKSSSEDLVPVVMTARLRGLELDAAVQAALIDRLLEQQCTEQDMNVEFRTNRTVMVVAALSAVHDGQQAGAAVHQVVTQWKLATKLLAAEAQKFGISEATRTASWPTIGDVLTTFNRQNQNTHESVDNKTCLLLDGQPVLDAAYCFGWAGDFRYTGTVVEAAYADSTTNDPINAEEIAGKVALLRRGKIILEAPKESTARWDLAAVSDSLATSGAVAFIYIDDIDSEDGDENLSGKSYISVHLTGKIPMISVPKKDGARLVEMAQLDEPIELSIEHKDLQQVVSEAVLSWKRENARDAHFKGKKVPQSLWNTSGNGTTRKVVQVRYGWRFELLARGRLSHTRLLSGAQTRNLTDLLKSVGLHDKQDIVNRHLDLLVGPQATDLQKLDALATSNMRRTYDGYSGKWTNMLEEMNIHGQAVRAFERAVAELVNQSPFSLLSTVP